MKLIALLTLVFALPSLVLAGDLAPEKAKCYRRHYSEEHMRKNPEQKLSKLFLKLSYKPYGENRHYLTGEVVGVAQKRYFGNTSPCEKTANGELLCQIECDGGSFRLLPNKNIRSNVNLSVNYFPLFLNRMSRVEDGPEPESIMLLDSDKANNLWRLEPADVRECDRALKAITDHQESGC